MKILFIFIFVTSMLYAQIPVRDTLFPKHSSAVLDTSSLDTLRNTFYKAVESEDKTEELGNYIKRNFSKDYRKYPPLVLAYYGGMLTLKAKHSFNPFLKFKYVLEGMDRLTEAVNLRPGSLEIRFLRFSVLNYLPSFFGYSEETKNDKDKICSLLLENDFSSSDYGFRKNIIDFMLKTGRLSQKQSSELKSLLLNLAENE